MAGQQKEPNGESERAHDSQQGGVKTVLILEPEILLGRAVVALLQRTCISTLVRDPAGSFSSLDQLMPEAVILCHRPPVLDAFLVLERLDGRLAPAKALLLGSDLTSAEIGRAIEMDLGGVLSNSASPEQLCWAVASILAGSRYIQPELFRQALLGPESTKVSTTEPLTEREKTVLRSASHGLSNQATAQAMNVSLSTVKYHLRSVFRKLAVQDRTTACVRALDLGILDSD